MVVSCWIDYTVIVPSGKAGKYYIFIHQHLRDQDANDDNSRLSARIYKNGSFFSEHQLAAPNGTNIFAGNLSNYVSFGIQPTVYGSAAYGNPSGARMYYWYAKFIANAEL